MSSIKLIGRHLHRTNSLLRTTPQVAERPAPHIPRLPAPMAALLIIVLGPGLALLISAALLTPDTPMNGGRAYAQVPASVFNDIHPGGATATPTCQSGWSVVTSPNPGPAGNFLFGVTAISENDVWAVG